jgi:hypothetical protein
MRRIEFSRRREEASCGVRGELLNRGSQVRILSPAPNPNSGRTAAPLSMSQLTWQSSTDLAVSGSTVFRL